MNSPRSQTSLSVVKRNQLTNRWQPARMSPVQPDSAPAAGETIGERLKRLRLERDLSQRELAAPGVSYAYISRIEAGERTRRCSITSVSVRPLSIMSSTSNTSRPRMSDLRSATMRTEPLVSVRLP